MNTLTSFILDAIVWIGFGLIVLLSAIVWCIDSAWQAARRAEERWAPWRADKWI